MQSQTVKKLGGGVALVMFIGLALIVFTLSTIGVWAVSQALYPGDNVRAGLNVLLYDFGMLAWLACFFFLCDSLPQYVIAFVAFVGNAAGVFALNVVSINISQTLTGVDRAAMGQWAVYIAEGIIIWHLFFALVHILAHPWAWSQIERGLKRAEVIGKAYEHANRLMDNQAEELAQDYAAGIHREAVAEIRGNGGGKDKQVKALTTTVEPVVYQRPASNGNGHSTGHGPNPT